MCAQGEQKKRKTVRAVIFALNLFLAAGANGQTSTEVNAPRPLDALGMSYSQLTSYLKSCDKVCKQHAKEAELGHRATFDLPPYSYTVELGKVIQVVIIAESFDGFVAEGSESWGPPKSLVYQDLEDPFGTESHIGTARWELPGGVIVDARQTKIPGKVVGVTKLKSADQRTVRFTQTEEPTDGAIVTITNPSAQQPKPKKVL